MDLDWETLRISGGATGFKLKEVVGVITSEVSENDTYNLTFCMVPMKFIAAQQGMLVTQCSDTVAT